MRWWFALLLSASGWAHTGGDGFVVLGPNDTPERGFIFAVQNIETKQMAFGYSRQIPTDPTRRVNTVLPGHVHLIAHSLGVTPEEFMAHHIPKPGEGKWVGGGFYFGFGALIFHRYFSLKAAGQLEKSIDEKERCTLNGLTPKVNLTFSHLMHADYWPDFFKGIAERFRDPFFLDPSGVGTSAFFTFNMSKHLSTEIRGNPEMRQLAYAIFNDNLANVTAGFGEALDKASKEVSARPAVPLRVHCGQALSIRGGGPVH